MVRVDEGVKILPLPRQDRQGTIKEKYMTQDKRKQILHDLKKVASAINVLIKDLDEVGEEVVSEKG